MIKTIVVLISFVVGFNIRSELKLDGQSFYDFHDFYDFGCVYAPSGCSEVCPKEHSIDPCLSDQCNFFGSVAGIGFCDQQIYKVIIRY